MLGPQNLRTPFLLLGTLEQTKITMLGPQSQGRLFLLRERHTLLRERLGPTREIILGLQDPGTVFNLIVILLEEMNKILVTIIEHQLPAISVGVVIRVTGFNKTDHTGHRSDQIDIQTGIAVSHSEISLVTDRLIIGNANDVLLVTCSITLLSLEIEKKSI